MQKSPKQPDTETAQNIAAAALLFICSQPDRLARFLNLTGLSPETMAVSFDEPEFQSSVLSHILADEAQLLVFASEARIDPDSVRPAHHILSGEKYGTE